MEFRLGERWEMLDDSIPAGELELLARDLIQVKDRAQTLLDFAKLNKTYICHFQAKQVSKV